VKISDAGNQTIKLTVLDFSPIFSFSFPRSQRSFVSNDADFPPALAKVVHRF
jgi:hypothetical protein